MARVRPKKRKPDSKRPRKRRLLAALGAFLLIALGIGGYKTLQLTAIGAAYHAKMLCSGVFVAGRDALAVESEDIAAGQHPILKLIKARVDREQRIVTAGLFGFTQRTAVYRDGLGCTLAIDKSVDDLRAQTAPTPQAHAPSNALWPKGDRVNLARLPRGIDGAALRAAIDDAFAEPSPQNPRRTRAVIVVLNGRIVAERYAPGFSADTPQISWSLAKSVTNALVGILVGEGKLQLDQPAPVPEWQTPGDARGAITLDQLMHMTSGLQFTEDYGAGFSDVVSMLFASGDMAAYAATRPSIAAAGKQWKYATGTTNIVSRIVRNAAANDAQDQLTFPRRALFDRLGMTSAVLEVDASGTYAGSAFMYATARDWARFGLFYLQDGVWQGQRILPKGWVAYSLTPTPPPPDNAGDFGAHLWRRVPKAYFNQNGPRPELPPGTFHMVGHHGQIITVVPSRKLVLVRLGLSGPWAWDQEEFVLRVLQALPKAK